MGVVKDGEQRKRQRIANGEWKRRGVASGKKPRIANSELRMVKDGEWRAAKDGEWRAEKKTANSEWRMVGKA
jgi:hypothetical protein